MAVLFFVVLLSFVSVLHGIENCNGGQGSDIISSLPGYTAGGGNPNIVQYAGFIEVNKTANGSMFYWLIEASEPTRDTPLMIWLNGGPGASSLTGLLAENGPFRIVPGSNGKTLTYNNYSWSTHYHMLFVDNPINTGFSFCNDGHEITNEDQMGANFLTFMTGFYECHPALKAVALYITGESYAGRYIPFIYKYLSRDFDVTGLAIGNGIYDPFIQFPAAPYYAFVNGIINHKRFVEVNATIAKCLASAASAAKANDINALNESANACLVATNDVYGTDGGNIFQYDIRVNDEGAFDAITNNVAMYLNQTALGEAIHTYDIPWKSSDGTSSPNPVSNKLNYDIILNNSAEIIPQALAKGTRIMFYNGQFDGSVCNNYGNQQCLAQLNYKGEWNDLDQVPYKLDGLCVAYVTQSSDKMLTYAVIADSGHLVPYNQPKSILDVLNKWVSGSAMA
eukprot:130659_1